MIGRRIGSRCLSRWFLFSALALSLCFSAAAETATPSTTGPLMQRQNVESLSWSELTSVSVVISRALVNEAENLQQQASALRESLTQLSGSYEVLERRFELSLQSAMSWKLEAAELSSSLAAASRSHQRSTAEQNTTIEQIRGELETARQQRDRERSRVSRWRIIGGIGLAIGAVGILMAM